MSAAALSRRLGCHKTTIARIAKRLRLGQRVGPVLLLTDDEIDAISCVLRKKSGNPKFVPGNDLWKLRKKIRKKKKKS
jgi:hypothetical protein